MNVVVILETLRRHVTNGFYIAYLALIAIVALGASNFDKPASLWPTLIGALAIICGAGVIGPEFSSGTLQLVLVKPVNRAIYLLSRVAGVVLAVWIGAGVGAVCEIVGRLAWGRAAYAGIGLTLLNAMCDAILTVALLALLGSVTRAYFNVAIYFAVRFTFGVMPLIIGMLRSSRNDLGQFLKEYRDIDKVLDIVERNLFPDVLPRFDRNWTLMVLANAAVALLLACIAFRKREVPYGAD
ncbi:MAG TPA: ABC transporter permease subunit [Thermoanaerobaculia bacterium]|nr:ABC transporter permease subunit [Thermoanaerobaculia bacterium]